MTRLLLMFLLFISSAAFAQENDPKGKRSDTVKYNRWLIIVERDDNSANDDSIRVIARKKGRVVKNSFQCGFDLGWANYIDNTNYTNAFLAGDVALGTQADDLKLNMRRSSNINLWFVMDELPIIKKVVQLQYGFGLELNNYFFESRNTYIGKNPMYVYKGTEDYKKAKLAADYISVPLLVKFNLTPNRNKNPFTIAGGVSGGFLYSARFKTKNSGDITKVRDDFEMNRFKFSYVGELGLGPIKLYGSYAMRDIFKNELNMTPYTIGFRFVD